MIAFSKVPYPGDEALTSCNCDECRWEVGRLRGKRWTRLSLDDLGAEDGAANVALLTPAAFHYYLPGLIGLALDHPGMTGDILGKVVRRLTASDREGEAARAKVDQVIKRLSGRQRRVLIDFIRQAGGSEPHVPAIWQSAIINLIDGVATSYDYSTVERWLSEEYGGKSGLPPVTGGPELARRRVQFAATPIIQARLARGDRADGLEESLSGLSAMALAEGIHKVPESAVLGERQFNRFI